VLEARSAHKAGYKSKKDKSVVDYIYHFDDGPGDV